MRFRHCPGCEPSAYTKLCILRWSTRKGGSRMANVQYVKVAAGLAEKIRNGHYQPGVQLPSLADIAKMNGVSDIVARKAIDLLEIQGLVRRVRRKGVFVSDNATLVRV